METCKHDLYGICQVDSCPDMTAFCHATSRIGGRLIFRDGWTRERDTLRAENERLRQDLVNQEIHELTLSKILHTENERLQEQNTTYIAVNHQLEADCFESEAKITRLQAENDVLKSLIEEAAEEIENHYNRDTELTLKMRQALEVE